MVSGPVYVVIYSAFWVAMFVLSCYLMSTVNPPPIFEKEPAEKPKNTIKTTTTTTALPTARRLDMVVDTATVPLVCFPISTMVNTPLRTTRIESSTLNKTSAKGRRSIQHPLRDLKKSGIVILEVTDDRGKPRFEIVFYPKRSEKQRTWRQVRREKKHGELQSKGVAGTVNKSVIKIMPNDTITLEETVAINSDESATNGSNSDALISAESAEYILDTVVLTEKENSERTTTEGVGENQQGWPSYSTYGLETKLPIITEILGNYSETKTPLPRDSAAEILDKKTVALETTSDAGDTQTLIFTENIVDDLVVEAPISAESGTVNLKINTSVSTGSGPVESETRAPVSVRIFADGLDTTATVFTDDAIDEMDTKVLISKESPGDILNTKAELSSENVANGSDIETSLSAEISTEKATDDLNTKVPLSTDIAAKDLDNKTLILTMNTVDDLGTKTTMSPESGADNLVNKASISERSAAHGSVIKTLTSAKILADKFDTKSIVSKHDEVDELDNKVSILQEGTVDGKVVFSTQNEPNGSTERLVDTETPISAENTAADLETEVLVSTEVAVDEPVNVSQQHVETQQRIPSTNKYIDNITINNVNDNNTHQSVQGTIEIPTTEDNINEVMAQSTTGVISMVAVESNDESVVVIDSIFKDSKNNTLTRK